MRLGDDFVLTSLLGSAFTGEIIVGNRAAIRPGISGTVWITGTHQHMLDPTDPWPEGYRLSDTLPAS